MAHPEQVLAWPKFKSGLQRRSSWLEAFSNSAVVQAIELVKAKPANDYEPLLLETTLKEASAALDRCLALQRQAYELEISAVKAAAEYELFLQLADLDASLETNALGIPGLQAEESGFRQASSLYTLDKGFPKHDATLSDRAKAGLTAAAERQALSKQRWEVRKKYEAEYHSRHTAPGNAHNFKERMERTVVLLADDLQEAYEKLVGVQRGLKAIYKKDLPLPALQGEGALDELVLWARDVIRFLDLESQQECNYDLVIPLSQKWRPSEKPIVTPQVLWQAVDQQGPQKVIRFELGDVFFNQERVRLRAVGLAFGAEPVGDQVGSMDRYAYWRLRATIHTPRQPSLTSPGTYYSRPPIVLGSVSAYGRSIPVAMRSGPECQNIDPRGEWTIVLNKYSVWSDSDAQTVESSPQHARTIADLKLFLSIVAKPLPQAASVFVP